MKVETEEKIAIMNETGNDYKMRGNIISVRLPRLELKKSGKNFGAYLNPQEQ